MNHSVNTLIFLCFLFLTSCNEQRYPDPLSPDEALNRFQLQDGFEIELYAAEPDVMDPVEMIFTENGDAYVAEMPDYPFMPEQGQGAGRIRILQDTDGDRRIDKNVVDKFGFV